MIDVCSLIDKNRKYYIYGITGLAKFIYDKITEKFGEDIILGFIQTVPDVEYYCGKKVYSVQSVMKFVCDSAMFILASKNKSYEMKKNLMDYGISENEMVNMKDYYFVNNSVIDKRIESILLWPSLEEENSDLMDKIKWFLPDRINVWISSTNKKVILDFAENKNINFISPENIDEKRKSVDFIYVWDADKIDADLVNYMDKIIAIDPAFNHKKDIQIYGNTYFCSFSEAEKESFVNHSKEVMKKMCDEFKGKKRANVFCTGPSIEEVYNDNFENEINIICNSMIKDKEWMERLKPNVLCFGDVAFYLSPNKYCQAFYKDLLFTFEKYHYYIIVYDYQVPLIKCHFPVLYDRLIGISRNGMEQYHFPDNMNLYVKATLNICTLFMLPIASTVCEEIGMAGCTGREAEETYFWKHNANTQYLDLMHYVFESYPAFFKYNDYEDYYDKHCQCIKDLIEYGEKEGKKYINLTTSFIPALKERTVREIGKQS